MAHCFSCDTSTRTLVNLLEVIGRIDLMITPTEYPSAPLKDVFLLADEEEPEINNSLDIVAMQDFYKRTFLHPYLKERGFCYEDYEYFPVGTTGWLNKWYATTCCSLPSRSRYDGLRCPAHVKQWGHLEP